MLCMSVIVPIAQPSIPLDILFKHAVGHTALPLYTSRHCLRSTINYTYNQVVVQPLFATNEESRYMKSNMCMNMYMHVCIVYIYMWVHTYIHVHTWVRIHATNMREVMHSDIAQKRGTYACPHELHTRYKSCRTPIKCDKSKNAHDRSRCSHANAHDHHTTTHIPQYISASKR